MEDLRGYNLNRYQQVTENISASGDFQPRTMQRHVQIHVVNKPYAICKFQKNVLENMVRWPTGTYFKIEEVK